MKINKELMQMAVDALESNNKMEKIVVARMLRECLSQPEPEPITVEFGEYLTRLNWQQGFERGWDAGVEKLTLTQEKLGYAALPKREWVGLTDEERQAIAKEKTYWDQIAVAVEAKLKEKNT